MARGRGFARAPLLAVVFVCAACGLVYELALVSLGSYLIGNTATQASIVLSVMVFAMGVGSLAAKPLQRHATIAFAVIELSLALLGGLSVMALYWAFAYLELYAGPGGGGVRARSADRRRDPLLMVLLQKIRRQDAGSAVADMFAVDYIGALVGGLCFPFLLLPWFGQLRGAIIVGLVNAVAGCFLVFVVFRRSLRPPVATMLGAGAAAVIVVLVAALVLSGRFEVTARQALFRDPIVAAERTRTRTSSSPNVRPRPDPTRGCSSTATCSSPRSTSTAITRRWCIRRRSTGRFGADPGRRRRSGAAEVLAYPDVRAATLVELDPEMISLARHDRRLRTLNRGSMSDPRATIVAADAFSWLRKSRQLYDVIIIDMPDPDESATAKLYSVEFYALAKAHLAVGGRMVVQAGSPYFARARSGASWPPCGPRTCTPSRTTSMCRRSGTGVSCWRATVPSWPTMYQSIHRCDFSPRTC